MTSWTNIPKPTGSNWIDVNPQGKEQYDQSSIFYDDSSIFYDGVNQSAWTDVPKPQGGGTTGILAGMITALSMPVTYSKDYASSEGWTKVPKPTN